MTEPADLLAEQDLRIASKRCAKLAGAQPTALRKIQSAVLKGASGDIGGFRRIHAHKQRFRQRSFGSDGRLARGFGIDQKRAASLRPEQGRSYFLTRMIKDVVFGEATLVARDPSAIKRSMMVRIGALAAAGLVLALAGAALIQTRSVNSAAIAALTPSQLAAYGTADLALMTAEQALGLSGTQLALLSPRHMTVVGDFSVRGGIKTVVTASYTAS